MRFTGKDWVATGAFLGAALYGAWLLLRSGFDLGATWSDGEASYDDLGFTGLRYAVWDQPERVEVGEEGAEGLALSADGRFAVFSVGEVGLNADLYLADVSESGLADPRPLAGLNSAFDELTPSFAPGELLFATNRAGPQLGFDLWRASFEDGVAGPPELIGGGVNGPADELDPERDPHSSALVFSSNRPRERHTDFDLFRAVPSEDGTWRIDALAALNTTGDEREPSLASDGGTLVFASNRHDDSGGFDLYRSFCSASEWLPAEPLAGLNTSRSERSPCFANDAFSLLFEETSAAGERMHWRARSREVFHVPTPRPSLVELLTLLALLVLGLLAWLAKRWRALDILYKCFLVSLLVHLLVLLYLRHVHRPPGSGAGASGPDRTFRVRLVPSPSSDPQRERAGELELEARRVDDEGGAPERAEERESPDELAPAAAAIAVPEPALADPLRSELELERASMSSEPPALADRETFERLDVEAPELALDAPRASGAAREDPSGAPARAAVRPGASAATPSSAETALAPRALETGEPQMTRQALGGAPDIAVVASPAVSGPRETFERANASAPALEIAPAFEVASLGAARAPAREVAAPSSRSRIAADAGPPAASPGGLAFDARAPELVLRSGAPRASSSSAPASNKAPTSLGPSVELRAPAESSVASRNERGTSSTFDALGDLARESSARTAPAANAPAHRSDFASSAAEPGIAPAEGLATELGQNVARTNDAGPERERATLGPSAAHVLPGAPGAPAEGLALRVPGASAEASPANTSASADFDALAGLSAGSTERGAAPSAGPDRRVHAEAERPPPSAPTGLGLAYSAPPSESAADDRPRNERPRLEHTPYKNRFGQEKLRALEEFGGGIETERAVAAGLAYLAGIQHEEGYWGETRDFHEKYGDVRVGKTGLALLAFLGAGHTSESETEHSSVAERAIRFLLETQQESSGHFGESSAYDHGIATYALAEAFAMTKDERLRAPISRALEEILRHQSQEQDPRFFGGWGYYFSDGHVWNEDPWPRVSVSAWQVMALESANLGGFDVPGSAFEDARAFLLRSWDPRREAFRYSHDPSRLSSGYPILPASTPAAVFALSLLGVDAGGQELARARRFILERSPDGYRYTGDDDFVHRARGNLYFWYYATLALFRAGGVEWERWNAAMKETLLPAQEEDGSWQPIDIYCEYAGDDEHERAYSTAMCVLTLEIYYRYFTPLLQLR